MKEYKGFGRLRKPLSIGSKLYFSVLLLFLVFAVAFIVFQQYRERQYKVETLNIKLQDINSIFQVQNAEWLSCIAKGSGQCLGSGKPRLPLPERGRHRHLEGLRITVILRDGRVVYDNLTDDYKSMGNHASRPEVAQALRRGSGSAVDRNSSTLGHEYFYSATFFPHEGYIVRSALPYNVDLVKDLQADQHYIWFAICVMALLTFVLYRFTSRLGRNITKLNEFAARASSFSLSATSSVSSTDNVELIAPSQLVEFSNDELGDTAARIVKLYLKLQRTQQEQDVLKRQLTQNVAHELKTPVASIQGYLETILENPRIDDATRRQFLERCFAQSKRLTALLADMSTLNRLDDGAAMMTFEDLDVAEIITTVEKESQFALEQKGMTMQCRIPSHIILRGNQGLIYSIFRNLIDNAIAYAGQGTRITLTCLPPSAEEPKLYRFTFSDNGVGVSPEHLPRLFERFYRVDKGRSRKMGGTGLGLAIVKNAVRVHGGTISASNNADGGLRFDFTLRKS